MVQMRTAKTCGPDAAVLASSCPGVHALGANGGKRAVLRGERVISRKAIAQGMSDCLRCPVCSYAQLSTILRTRPRVQRAFPAPSDLKRAKRGARLGHLMPRECGPIPSCCLTIESEMSPPRADSL